MKKMLLIFTLYLAFCFQSFSQNCVPSDACAYAPKLNMNGYVTSLLYFSPGTEPINCPNGQQWGVHNDLWIAFVPKQANLEIFVDIIGNCSSGDGVQALIHDNCASNPIDCDVDCGGSASVGGAVTFISGKTYYLRIDGCSGAVCPVQISVNPSTAIESQSDTLNSNLSDISGLNTITCLGDKTYTYCTIPINDCSKDYNWIIESGNAIIDNSGGQIIDNDPSNPGKNISKTGIGRNCVNLKFKGAGPIKLSVIGSNGINFTNKVTKTIEVLQTTNDSININICPNQYFYENDTLPGGPFPPGFPCKKAEIYDIPKKNKDGCEYYIKLSVTQLCDTIYNLGEIALCPNEKFRVGDLEFDSTAIGPQEVVCKVKPSQNANLNPPQCDTIKTFIISAITINPIIFPEKYTLPCVDSKITLNAKSSNWYPIDTALLKSISFKWHYYTPAPGNGWQVIPDATQDTLLVDKPGRYRLITILEVKYKDGFGNIKVKTCSKTSKQIVVSPLGTNSLETPDYELVNSFCIGKPYSLNIINPDPNLIYNWVKIPQNDTIISTSIKLDMNNPYQIVCLQSKSLCGLNSITRCDTIFNKSKLPIDENISFQGYNSGCSGKEIGLKLLNNNNYLINVLHSYKDTINSRIEKDSIFLKFKYAGTYQIQFEVSNACNAKTISKQFIIDQSVPKISIRGPKTAIEKTTQTYCVNNPNNNAITWTTSKNLKYKVSSTNKQSCIYVTFPKGINVGWIKSTISNNCSNESDSILIVSKPKLGNTEIEQLDEDSKNINDRATQTEVMDFSVFPNPATNTIEVKGNQPYDQIEILDVLGKSILIDNNSNKFDISELNAGFYILKIISNKKVLAKNTFIKID